MKNIYSKSGELLHKINRFVDITGRTDISDAKEHLQLATLRLEKGKTFKPHKHIYKQGEPQIIAQESWVIISGKVRVYFYDTDNSFIESDILYQGDCSLTYSGGHTYEILADDTVVYEYKTGPYTGIENDKVQFVDDNNKHFGVNKDE
jgi:cupin fold WbuC family metalloprotein